MVTDPVAVLTRFSVQYGHRVNHAIVIAPEASGSNDRTVIGNKAHYLGANIDVRLKSRTSNINCVVRFTIVELLTQITRPQGTVDITQALDDFYKNEYVGSDDESYADFDTAQMVQRDYYSINENKFRVLKQSFVSLGNTGSTVEGHGPSSKSSSAGRFRAFIPMKRILDYDYTALYAQVDDAGTGTTNVSRSSYEKPVVMVMEYFFPPGTTATTNMDLVSYDYCVKHSIKDSV